MLWWAFSSCLDSEIARVEARLKLKSWRVGAWAEIEAGPFFKGGASVEFQVKKPAGGRREKGRVGKGGDRWWECFENFSGCYWHKVLQALQVTSPAGFKGKGSAGWRCGCSRCGVTSEVWRDHPECLCVFSWHCELQRAGARTWPGRSSQTHTGRPNRTNAFFLQQNRDRVSPGLGRFEATSQDDSLFPISQVSESSVWARHSETLQTPDCAAAARAEATYNFKTTISRSCLLQSTSVYYNLPHGDSSDAVLQWFSFIRHITHGKRMGIQRIWTD